MNYVFSPAPQPALPVAGTDTLFPIHRIYCVGRNYAEHTREMGHDPDKEPPFFFLKDADNVTLDGSFPYPPGSSDVHHEIELVVALKSGGRDIAPEAANQHIFGYAVGLDMTRRDLQATAKKMGRPWEVGKSFDKSAPITPLQTVASTGLLTKGAIWLDVNGERRQSSDISQLIWDVPNQIAFLSKLWELKAGDLIMTGTPAGVNAVKRGDRLVGHVDGLADLVVSVV